MVDGMVVSKSSETSGVSASTGVAAAVGSEAKGGKLIMAKPKLMRKPKKDFPTALVRVIGDDGQAGVVVSTNGYIIASSRGANEGDSVDVLFSNGIYLGAKVLAVESDLALLKVGAKNLSAVKLTSIEGPTAQTKLYTGETPEEGKTYSLILPLVFRARIKDGFKVSGDDAILLGSPVALQSSEVIGVISNVPGEGHYEVIDAKRILNVFNLSYD